MICAIFAVDDTNGMGFDGSMPWPRNRQDLKWFKRKTQNHTVVMGKKTWECTDMPIPLPDRTNVLVTSKFIERDDIIQLNGDVCEGLLHLQELQGDDSHIFVIGGPNLLMQALPVIDCVYLTRIPGEYINDTYIDLDTFLKDFELHDSTDMGSCTIQEYNRCNNS